MKEIRLVIIISNYLRINPLETKMGIPEKVFLLYIIRRKGRREAGQQRKESDLNLTP